MPAKGVLDAQNRSRFPCLQLVGATVCARTAMLMPSLGGRLSQPPARLGRASRARGVAAPRSAYGLQRVVDAHVEAEELGFHSSFVTEHHFTGIGQMSAILTMLTFIAARTTRLRLGTAVLVLPWHNPVLLAEQVATLDMLSAGRFDLGVGKGYRHNE